jgi:hypothetical protein
LLPLIDLFVRCQLNSRVLRESIRLFTDLRVRYIIEFICKTAPVIIRFFLRGHFFLLHLGHSECLLLFEVLRSWFRIFYELDRVDLLDVIGVVVVVPNRTLPAYLILEGRCFLLYQFLLLGFICVGLSRSCLNWFCLKNFRGNRCQMLRYQSSGLFFDFLKFSLCISLDYSSLKHIQHRFYLFTRILLLPSL